jgi:hypothetical protein
MNIERIDKVPESISRCAVKEIVKSGGDIGFPVAEAA